MNAIMVKMNKYIKKFLLFALISICLEICVFNFESIRSRLYSPHNEELHIYYEDEFIEDNGIHILENNKEFSTIEIYDINDNIKNIYVDFEIEGNTELCKTEYYLADEGTESLYLLNNNDIIWNNNALSSKYLRINSYGSVDSILIKIYKNNDETLKINSISLNVVRPLLISKIRVLVIWMLMVVISLFVGKDNLLNVTYASIKPIYKKMIIAGLILVQIIISLSVGMINKELIDLKYNEQYQKLTDSLITGHTYLDIDVDKRLLELENPYDLGARLDSDTECELDTAFYGGKYYVYFGVAPVIIYYLPFKLISNTYLCDYVVNIINYIILSLSIIFLSKKICEKYFNNIPILIFALLTFLCINASGSLNLLSEPRIYTIPILMALAYSCLGLTLWIYSKKDGKINNLLVALGSLSISIAIGSRPQFGLFAFFALIIFFDEIKQIKKYFISFIWAIVPFVIVGGLLMYYNYIRFDSPFDFGANYNLTLNDMTHRGFKLDRIPSGIFYYLLQTMPLVGTFPYIYNIKVISDYVGNLISEYSFGGLFMIHPFTIASLFILKIRKYFENKKLYVFGLVSIIFGFIIIILDTEMAGLLERYFADFSIYFIFTSLLVILVFINYTSLNKEIIYKILFWLVMISLIYCFFRIFANTYQTLEGCNPKLYYKVASLFKLS